MGIGLDYQRLFEGTPAPMLILRADLRIVAVNDAYLRATMTRREELVDRHIFDAFPDNPHDPGATGVRNLRASLDTVLRTTFVKATGSASDEQRTRAALGWRFEEMQTELYNRAQDLEDANRSLREAVAELAAKEEQLRIAHEAKDRFLAVLSHELRNPLSAIRGALDVLADTIPNRGQREQMMHGVIERQTSALTRMTDDLLDITRAQVGKLELNRNRVDLGELVGAVVRSIQTSEGVGARRIETRLPESALFVDGDPIRLGQAIANLLGNAVKFTQPAGRIEIDVRDADGTAWVSVRDDGRGFEPSRARELFEPFAQADSSLARTTAGLGLGLPIVRNIIELHGGQVTGHSDGPGQGACFTIELPAVPVAAVERPPEEIVLRRGPGARVLVIEDNRDVATAYVALLERLGHQVIVETFGEAGVETAAAVLPDAVLCDIGLPDIDGHEVARRLRADRRTAHIPLLAASGYGQAPDLRQSTHAGFDQHLVKPFSREDLARALSNVLPDGALTATSAEPGNAEGSTAPSANPGN